jgi:hypothetical protein
VFGGGPEIHDAILASDATLLVRTIGSVVWHGISAMLLLNSVALLFAVRSAVVPKALVLLVVGQYLSMAGLFVFYGLHEFKSLMQMPQWTGFVVISCLALIGIRAPARTSLPQSA